MIIRSAVFNTSATDLDSCPPPGLPEFPFIGRSNVGKSSLINLLTSRKGLARVSGAPGHTRMINFFTINDAWRIVDLPGYGHVEKKQGAKEKFAEIISEFLPQREGIRTVFVLIDSRHEPQRIDIEFTTWLANSGVPFVLVFTKVDKLKPAGVTRNVAAFQASLAEWTTVQPRVFTCSSETGAGRTQLMTFISSLL